MPPKKPQMYFDGSCKACQVFADHAANLGVDVLDVHAGHVPESVTPAEALEEMYVVRADGSKLRGADAVFEILRHRWYWRPIVSILSLPGLLQLSRYLYRVFARHRHTLSQFLP